MQTLQQHDHVLYVAWQQPDSRRYYPAARLMAGVGPHSDLYEFVYITGAQEAEAAGFAPFPAFADLSKVYRSKELFPFFSNRLMSIGRPDYPSYLQALGLEPDARPMAVLARSGGARTTDSIELFALPTPNGNDRTYGACFWMHGFRYMQPNQQARVLALRPGEELTAARQENNAADPHAVRLFTQDHVDVGYMPRYVAGDAVSWLSSNARLRVFVQRVNPPPAPTQQRLLCRIEISAQAGFQPFASDAFQPISPDATNVNE